MINCIKEDDVQAIMLGIRMQEAAVISVKLEDTEDLMHIMWGFYVELVFYDNIFLQLLKKSMLYLGMKFEGSHHWKSVTILLCLFPSLRLG